MTPKEKAIELVDRFTFSCRECDYEGNANMSALIVVDEIISGSRLFYFEDYKYWKEVKQEIELL